jgi:hypothetical protein
VIVYLLMGVYLDQYLKVANYEVPDYATFAGNAAVVVGLIVAILLWLLLAVFYRRYTSARSANRRNYILLVERLDRLSTRIEAPSDVLKAVRQQALAQATHERDEIGKDLGQGHALANGPGGIHRTLAPSTQSRGSPHQSRALYRSARGSDA